MEGAVTIRAQTPEDEPAVLRLLAAAMGWQGIDADAEYFRWKHADNPFGRSPGWVAVHGDDIVGLRIFMRWEFADGDRRYRAVRAVDTATHPDHRGKGIFRDLTLRGLQELEAEGVDFVFNTPNEQSKPGYLKMGWQEVGRLPAAVRIRSPLVLPRLARSRVAAQRQPVPTDVGAPVTEVVGQVAELVPALPAPDGLATPRTEAFLRWRYGLDALGYRAWQSPDGGWVLFRLRRRGPSTELVVSDLLLPAKVSDARAVERLVRLTRADYALRIAEPGSPAARLTPPALGPVLTWRALSEREMPALDRWRLVMGDVELF